MFKKIINRLHQDERGITGLETAIILIAFVVVASVFAYTVISAGLFSARHAEEAIRAGIGTAETTMMLRGGVIARGNVVGGNVTHVGSISFTVSNVHAGGQPIDLTPRLDDDANNITIISYDDADTVAHNVLWVVEFAGGFEVDDNYLLEAGEIAIITVTLPADANLGTNAIFNLQVMPPHGATLMIQRRTPPVLEAIMRL